MEFIFELLIELIFESSLEISKNKKISKWIRYPVITLISLFFIGVIGLIAFLGVRFWTYNKVASFFFILIAITLLIGCIIKLKKTYKNIIL